MQDIRFLYTSQLFGWFFDYFVTMLHNRFYSFSRFCQDTKAQSFIFIRLIGFEQSARHKVSFPPIYRYTSYKNNCHSPDGSGNPFVPVPIAIGRNKRLQRTAGNSSLFKSTNSKFQKHTE